MHAAHSFHLTGPLVTHCGHREGRVKGEVKRPLPRLPTPPPFSLFLFLPPRPNGHSLAFVGSGGLDSYWFDINHILKR